MFRLTFLLIISFIQTSYSNCVEDLTSAYIEPIFLYKGHSSNPLYDISIDTSDYADHRGKFDSVSEKKLEISKLAVFKQENDLYSLIFHSSKFPSFALKIGDFNFSSTFEKKIKGLERNSCVARIQSHFEEYNRKSKVIDKIKYNQSKDLTPFQIAASRAFYNRLDVKAFIITNNCRGAGNFEFEWPGHMKGNFVLPFEFINELMEKRNCYSRGATYSYTEKRYPRFDIDNNQRKAKTIKQSAISLYSKFFEKDYTWFDPGSFDKAAKNCNIKDFSILDQSDDRPRKVELKRILGKINYQEFPKETQYKSGYFSDKDPISFVKTPCGKSDFKMPLGFATPREYLPMRAPDFWKKGTCEIVPHRFQNYEELSRYEVYLSKFEVDGVYTGKAREQKTGEIIDYDRSLLSSKTKHRLHFKYNEFIDDFIDATIQVSQKKLITLTLNNKSGRNLVIGNIPLSELEAIEKIKTEISYLRPFMTDKIRGIRRILGIAPHKLSNKIEDSLEGEIEAPIYSVFFDDKGQILNHHALEVGVEMWSIKKVGEKLVIDLISHERITPVARFEVSLPGAW